MPTGLAPALSLKVRNTRWRDVSTTDIVPPISVVMYARRPSGENAAPRGRGSTRKLATTLLVVVSITDTVLLVSAVTYTSRPDGLIATPSGSIPTRQVASTFPLATVVTEA